MRIELDSQLKAEEVLPEIKLKKIVQAQWQKAGQSHWCLRCLSWRELQLLHQQDIREHAETIHVEQGAVRESVGEPAERLVGCADAYPQKWSLSLSQSAVSESFIRYWEEDCQEISERGGWEVWRPVATNIPFRDFSPLGLFKFRYYLDWCTLFRLYFYLFQEADTESALRTLREGASSRRIILIPKLGRE